MTTLRKTIIVTCIITGVVTALAGCGIWPVKTPENREPMTEKEQEMKTNQVIAAGDLISAAKWIGRNPGEISEIPNDQTAYFDIEGQIFDFPAGGTLSIRGTGDERVVNRITLMVKKASLQDFNERLMDLYGGAMDWGQEPYVEVNGGALEWYCFDAGEAIIKISQGSEVDYVMIEYTVNSNPQNTEKLVLRPMEDAGIQTLQMAMIAKVTGYDNGILTVSILNQTGDTMTYTDEYVLAKSSDGGQTYAHLSKVGFELAEEANEFEIADTQTQELKCDLRTFGKIEAGLYMIILDDMSAEFELVPESENTAEVAVAPWFCPNCGTKNRNGDVCTDCGAKKE